MLVTEIFVLLKIQLDAPELIMSHELLLRFSSFYIGLVTYNMQHNFNWSLINRLIY